MNNSPYESADYLGDGMYIEWDGFAYWIRANDHRDTHCTDKICLEPKVIDALNRFVTRMEQKTK